MHRLLTAGVLVVLASIASAQTRTVFIEDMTSYEIRDAMAAGKTSAIIFAGGLEQNGPHMALVKHNVIARYVAGQIAERMGNALVYPIMPFSPAGDPVATGLVIGKFAGLSASTIARVVKRSCSFATGSSPSTLSAISVSCSASIR